MKILVLPKFDRLGASSRLRTLQYVPYLHCASNCVVVSPMISDHMLAKRYSSGRYSFQLLLSAYFRRLLALMRSSSFDLIWIEKEALPWVPAWFELILLSRSRYVLDYDDAVFHNYDLHSNKLVRLFFGSRLDRLMNRSTLVVGGNCYLAKRAVCAGAPWVEILPTVVDLDRYHLASQPHTEIVPRIVWIGSPSTAHYLNILCEPLRQLASTTPFVLRVVGAQGVTIPGVQIETISWAENTEVDSIASCAVGIMPLEDSPWERGKCGYKLIQYMACGLPVVASAIGANLDIVENNQSGFLVQSSDEWVAALKKLLVSTELRSTMGRAGRIRVEEKYCLQKTGPRLVELLRIASTK